MQGKKSEALQQFRRNRDRTDRPDRLPKSRQLKPRLKTKEVFLTDTQTSDYTKSSGEMGGLKIEYLEKQIKSLQKQNEDLKRTIMDMKASNYIQINEQKVKELIQQNQKYQQEIEYYRKQYEGSILQRDFLARFNKNLKVQCQSLTKELIQLKALLSQYQGTDFKPKFEYGRTSFCNESSEEASKFPYRSASTEITLTRKREYKKKQGKQHAYMKKNTGTPCTEVSQNYFSLGSQASVSSLGMRGKTNRQKY